VPGDRRSRSTNRDLAVAHHEAGHAVACFYQRIRIRKVSIEPEDSAAGSIRFRNPLEGVNLELTSSDGDRLKMERLATVCFAGGLAQRHFSKHSYRTWHDEDDRMAASNLIRRFVGSHEQLDAYYTLLRLQTEDLVEGSWWADIQKLATALVQNRVLSTKRVRAIIVGNGRR